jgi:hypothetical protein
MSTAMDAVARGIPTRARVTISVESSNQRRTVAIGPIDVVTRTHSSRSADSDDLISLAHDIEQRFVETPEELMDRRPVISERI